MTPVEVLAAHLLEYDLWGDGFTCSGECQWRFGDKDTGSTSALPAHAAHVLDALTKAGWAVEWPLAYVTNASRIVGQVEEWAALRVQDWHDSAAQDVLDIINEEGEWADPAAAAGGKA